MLRRWPAGIWAQSSAELAHMLQQKYAFSPEQVEEILVDPPVEGYMDIPREELILDIHAQNAIPFVVASDLTDPVPGAHWYSSGRMRDTKLLALAQRVKPGPSQAQSVISNYQCFQKGSYPNQRMIIKLKDGTQYQAETDARAGIQAICRICRNKSSLSTIRRRAFCRKKRSAGSQRQFALWRTAGISRKSARCSVRKTKNKNKGGMR